MENSNKLWIAAAVLAAGAIFWGVGQAVGPSNGDEEFQKSLEAMKQIKSFRATYVASGVSSHMQTLWEVDCGQVIVHQQSQNSQTGGDSTFEMKEDELSVGTQRYRRDGNGSWENAGTMLGDRDSAKWHCDRVAQGTANDLLPDMLTMVHHATTEKGDKKTVNGVRCREWKFDSRTAMSTTQGSVCLGLEDHLPYEMTMAGGRYSYSDYNRPIQFDVPSAMLQTASSTEGSN